MKNLVVLFFAAFMSQIAFAQQTATTPTPAAEKKACCTSAEKSGKSCCAKTADAKGAACAHGTADASATNAKSEATTSETTVKTVFVKKVAVVTDALQTAQFQVWGNCGMCKKTIEKAANSVAGVENATWNVETHQFNVIFDQSKVKVEQVHQAIADAGYDTDLVRGNDTAYNNLHGCCQYERKAQ